MEPKLPYFSSRRSQSPDMIASKPQMPSIQLERSAPRAGVNASSEVQTEAVEPMILFLAPQSYRRGGTACTDMHAANTETTTEIPDVQNNGSLHFLGTTPINLRKLCKPLEGKDTHSLWHVFSCGFRLQYMGPR